LEVTTVSDAGLSQEDDMRRVASRICEFANSIKRGAGNHLHLSFFEESGYTAQGYIRRRRLDSDFVPGEETKQLIKAWLTQGERKKSLEITQGSTQFLVKWHDALQPPMRNFYSSMPAEAYSLELNPLFAALIEKKRQLRIPEFEGLRCVLVADTGSRLLQDLNASRRSNGTFTGREIIEHFLRKSNGAVDAVIVISPRRESQHADRSTIQKWWFANLFERPGLTLCRHGVDALIGHLPTPRFEAFQARSLQQQAAYRRDARGWYLGTHITSIGTQMTIKISARALLDLLANRITTKQFRDGIGLADKPALKNIFAHRLERGDVLSRIDIEPGGVDEDDDWLVVHFAQDPAASPLKINNRESPGDASKTH